MGIHVKFLLFIIQVFITILSYTYLYRSFKNSNRWQLKL